MKLRIQGNNVRLRLSDAEVARLGRGEEVFEETRFTDGVLAYRLSVSGDAIAARFSRPQCIEVSLPEHQAQSLASGGEVSLRGEIAVDGDTLIVLIEKDLKAKRD